MRWMDSHLEWLKITHPHTFQNDDGTYWNEGQLRADYLTFCKDQGFCGSERRCGYLCCALPGDTLSSFEIDVEDWKTATQEELIDRGYIQNGHSGLLFQLCQAARDDPAQFDLNEDAEDEKDGAANVNNNDNDDDDDEKKNDRKGEDDVGGEDTNKENEENH